MKSINNLLSVGILTLIVFNCSYFESPRKNCQDKIDYKNVDALACRDAVRDTVLFIYSENASRLEKNESTANILDRNISNTLLIICLRNALNERNCNKKADNVFGVK